MEIDHVSACCALHCRIKCARDFRSTLPFSTPTGLLLLFFFFADERVQADIAHALEYIQTIWSWLTEYTFGSN